MKWLQYLVVIFLTIIIVSIFWNVVLHKIDPNLELEDLRYFCVMDYCETPRAETGYYSLKTPREKKAEMKLFCEDLQLEFNEDCGQDLSGWGDWCLIRNERIEMFCN